MTGSVKHYTQTCKNYHEPSVGMHFNKEYSVSSPVQFAFEVTFELRACDDG